MSTVLHCCDRARAACTLPECLQSVLHKSCLFASVLRTASSRARGGYLKASFARFFDAYEASLGQRLSGPVLWRGLT